MNRRTFLTRVAAAVALTLSRHLPGIGGAAPARLVPQAPVLAQPLLRSDLFAIEGIYAKHPVTGRRTDFLQWYTVTDDVAAGVTHVPAAVIWPSVHEAVPIELICNRSI